jgi:hypothetical protein
MSWEIDPEKANDSQQPEKPKNYNKRLVESLFSDGMSETPHNFVQDYILELLKISQESISAQESTHINSVIEPLPHDVLRGIIGHYFGELGWDYALEVRSDDPQNSHKFDVVAQKDWHTIIVEVKPNIDIADFEQILTHIEDARSTFSRIRLFLGTDFANIRYLLSGNDITDVLIEFAVRYQLGVIFANHEEFWIVPTEFLMINTDF